MPASLHVLKPLLKAQLSYSDVAKKKLCTVKYFDILATVV